MIDACTAQLRQDLQQALMVFQQGGVVAFPTETYYGLAVDPFNRQAVDRLFQVKRRSTAKPILVLIDNQERLPRLTAGIPPQFHALMERFWPGPLTLLFPARAGLPAALTAGSGTIGIRVSSHPLAQSFCSLAGGAITATSANLSGFPPATNEQEVQAQFGHHLGWVLKAGPTPGGAASTIVAAIGAGLRLIREGAIPFTEISSPGRAIWDEA